MGLGGKNQHHNNEIHGNPRITIHNIRDYNLIGQIMNLYNGPSEGVASVDVKNIQEGMIYVTIKDKREAEMFVQSLIQKGFDARLDFVRELKEIPEADEDQGDGLYAQQQPFALV